MRLFIFTCALVGVFSLSACTTPVGGVSLNSSPYEVPALVEGSPRNAYKVEKFPKSLPSDALRKPGYEGEQTALMMRGLYLRQDGKIASVTPLQPAKPVALVTDSSPAQFKATGKVKREPQETVNLSVGND